MLLITYYKYLTRDYLCIFFYYIIQKIPVTKFGESMYSETFE